MDLLVKLLPNQVVWTPARALAQPRPPASAGKFQVRAARNKNEAEIDAVQALLNGLRMEKRELCLRMSFSHTWINFGS